MSRSSARIQAAAAIGLAAVLGGAWLQFGTPIRVRWIVARGAPPALEEDAERAVDELRSLGAAARPVLASILEDGSSRRSTKSFVASILLRSPFFDRAAVEGALVSTWKPTARAAAFALMDGEKLVARESPARKGTVVALRAPLEAWDPAPAIPVLADWIADASAPDATYAARLLGKIPPGDRRVRDALLAAVERTPEILAMDVPVEMGRRKFVVIYALEALRPWAREDEDVAARVAKVVTWIEENGKSDIGWEIQKDGLEVIEAARGRGVEMSVLRGLLGSRNPIVRMRLCHALETVTGPGTGDLLRELLRDETRTVRRSAIMALRKRKDPMLLDLAGYLVEDGEIYARSDVVRAMEALRGSVPGRVREVLPLLASCLEDPWPGPPLPDAYFESAKADVIDGAALSLYLITFQCPGFVLPGPPGGRPELAVLDDGKRAAIAKELAADPERRKGVADEWRKIVPPWSPSDRIPGLVGRLEDHDPVTVLRACRELHRLTGESTGFPPSILSGSGDAAEARNLIREMRRKGEWQKVVDAWKGRK